MPDRVLPVTCECNDVPVPVRPHLSVAYSARARQAVLQPEVTGKRRFGVTPGLSKNALEYPPPPSASWLLRFVGHRRFCQIEGGNTRIVSTRLSEPNSIPTGNCSNKPAKPNRSARYARTFNSVSDFGPKHKTVFPAIEDDIRGEPMTISTSARVCPIRSRFTRATACSDGHSDHVSKKAARRPSGHFKVFVKVVRSILTSGG